MSRGKLKTKTALVTGAGQRLGRAIALGLAEDGWDIAVHFHRSRVPAQTLLDYIEAGESIDEFLDGFPSVTRTQVVAFLEDAKDRLIEP